MTGRGSSRSRGGGPRLCWVHEPPAAFEPLVAAARARELRVGWLLLGPITPVAELEPAARCGMARSVAVGGGASVALKPIAGEPVLGDLLRGHFPGFALVLLSGDPAHPGVRIDPGLEPARLWRSRSAGFESSALVGETWRLLTPDGRERTLSTEQLLGRLRRPRW